MRLVFAGLMILFILCCGSISAQQPSVSLWSGGVKLAASTNVLQDSLYLKLDLQNQGEQVQAIVHPSFWVLEPLLVDTFGPEPEYVLDVYANLGFKVCHDPDLQDSVPILILPRQSSLEIGIVWDWSGFPSPDDMIFRFDAPTFETLLMRNSGIKIDSLISFCRFFTFRSHGMRGRNGGSN